MPAKREMPPLALAADDAAPHTKDSDIDNRKDINANREARCGGDGSPWSNLLEKARSTPSSAALIRGNECIQIVAL